MPMLLSFVELQKCTLKFDNIQNICVQNLVLRHIWTNNDKQNIRNKNYDFSHLSIASFSVAWPLSLWASKPLCKPPSRLGGCCEAQPLWIFKIKEIGAYCFVSWFGTMSSDLIEFLPTSLPELLYSPGTSETLRNPKRNHLRSFRNPLQVSAEIPPVIFWIDFGPGFPWFRS